MANMVKSHNKFVKFFVFFLALFMSINLAGHCIEKRKPNGNEFGSQNRIKVENTDYYKIYDELQEADFKYIFKLDPYQSEEYKSYMYAPYPLFRTAIEFTFKNTTIPAGYYLLTPREKDGVWYVLFKTNGKVQYVIPVYKRELVEPLFYEQYIPTKKMTLWQKICKKTTDAMGTLFPESTQRKPAPKSFIDVNELNTEFMEIVLYYGVHKYHMIFMR